MEKLKKSAVAKVVAAILLSVSILATVVSGVVVSMAFSYGTTRRVQGEAIYDEFMSRMVDDSASRARDYYQAYLQSEAEGQESHTVWYYKDYFAEENSNFFFKIVPEDTKKYPTLENYESKDYQFHEVLSQQTQLLEGSTSFSYKLSLPDIIKFWKENYVPDEYSYDDRAAYEEDADVFSSELQVPSTIQDMYWDWSTISFDDLGISYDDDSSNPYIYLVNTDFVYYLSNDEGYTKALESAIKKLGDGDIQYMDISYRNDGTVTQELEISTPISYTMYAYVKSNMTARDLYANSIVLRYCIDRVTCISTPGSTVDVIVTQHGIAVNPRNKDLQLRLQNSGLPVTDIETLKNTAEKITGIPSPLKHGKKAVANIMYRDGSLLDQVYCIDTDK